MDVHAGLSQNQEYMQKALEMSLLQQVCGQGYLTLHMSCRRCADLACLLNKPGQEALASGLCMLICHVMQHIAGLMHALLHGP